MCSMVVCVLLPRFELSVAAGGRAELARGPVALAPEPGREPLIGEASAAAGRHGELEAGKEDADDHRTHVRMLLPRVATVQARPDGSRAEVIRGGGEDVSGGQSEGSMGVPGKSPNCGMATSGDKGMVSGQIEKGPSRSPSP